MVEIDSEEVRNGYVKRQLKVTNSKVERVRSLSYIHKPALGQYWF